MLYTSTSGLDSDRSSSLSMDMGGDNSQIYNDTVKVNCRVVCECIRKEVKKNILDSLKSRRKGRGQEGFAQEMGTIVV